VSTHLGGSFDCVFTQETLKNIYNFFQCCFPTCNINIEGTWPYVFLHQKPNTLVAYFANIGLLNVQNIDGKTWWPLLDWESFFVHDHDFVILESLLPQDLDIILFLHFDFGNNPTCILCRNWASIKYHI
jgi:hypothetical protein